MAIIKEVKQKKPYWVTYIQGRIKKNRNFLGFISGATGSGKSWSGLSICKMCDPTFDKTRIVCTMKDLMKLINTGNLKGGSSILWDEAGIDISNKNWQSLTNKCVNFLLQTFRHNRFILIFTSPHIDYIDASTRKLFHAEFSMMKIDYTKEVSKLKPQIIQYNGRSKKFYYKYLRVSNKKFGVVPLKFWNIPKPDNELIEDYELIKKRFTTQLNKDIELQLRSIDKDKPKDERKPLTQIQEKVMKLMGKYDDIDKVREETGISRSTLYFHIGQSKKKNWKVEDFLQNTPVT